MPSYTMHAKILLWSLLLLTVFSFFACRHDLPKQSGAGQAMDYWRMLRSYPDGKISTSHLSRAYDTWNNTLSLRNEPEWKSLGPKNLGGRTLCLAFHPEDKNVIYAGSASGGIWVSRTAGKGAEAWERVRTDYPVMGVSSIAINPDQPEELFIGTGEVYNYQTARPGIDDRFNRGSYGIGILRSTDGGLSWKPSLDWRNTELRGVWKIIFNPLRSATLLAATTEGIFRSRDRGENWQRISNRRMATDIEIHPVDTNVIYVSHGGYQSPETGIYRSVDGGNNFELLRQLPTSYTGKAAISLVPSEPDWLYVSIADDLKSIGLFRSIDRGDNWSLMNTTDVAQWQGWYAHDVAVHPTDPARLIYVGIDTWRSLNGGRDLKQLSFWQNWQFGKTAVGAPEGPTQYVHADIHAAYYHPADPNQVFVATDGGIFVSTNGGSNWTSRNGSYQTQQFYADFASATRDSNLAMGGLQDNSTVLYDGEDAWSRRIGGDGMTTAIDPEDHKFVYGSLQNLQVLRSADGGDTFRRLIIGRSANEIRNFNSPFVLDPIQPSRMYAGAENLYVSDDRGGNWTSFDEKDGNNAILRIAVAPGAEELIYLSTNAPDGSRRPGVFQLTNGRQSNWVRMEGLPEQLCTDLVFHPEDNREVYAVFGGYNTAHVFRTRDGGQTWQSIDNNLPDLPTHTLFIDPEHPQHLYVGNDMGVFFSENSGAQWHWISKDIAEAVMVMDLSYSPQNRALRVATHGLGAYELSLDNVKLPEPEAPTFTIAPPFPNPTIGAFDLKIQTADTAGRFNIQVVDVAGRVLETHRVELAAGLETKAAFDLTERAAGVYWLVVEDEVGAGRWVFRTVKL